MPHTLVRGHMRFDQEEYERKAELESKISSLEAELEELRKEFAITKEAEAEFERKNSKLVNKMRLVGNRRAKRDAMVNAAEAFERDLGASLSRGSCHGRETMLGCRDLMESFAGCDLHEEDTGKCEEAIHAVLLGMMYVARKELGLTNIDLQSILRK